jgi:hypothetical protein
MAETFSVSETGVMGTAWMLDETYTAELEATAHAAAHALLACASGLWIAAGTGVVPTTVENDFIRMEHLLRKLFMARKNFSDTTKPMALDMLRLDGASDEVIALADKLISTVISGYARALMADHETEMKVTRLAEGLIELRAEAGNYTIEEEASDYSFARSFFYGLRKPAGAPTLTAKMSDGELNARLNAIV